MEVHSYVVDNVRIRYRADNVTEAYAAGFDARLNGEFIPGTESWISLGILQTNIMNKTLHINFCFSITLTIEEHSCNYI